MRLHKLFRYQLLLLNRKNSSHHQVLFSSASRNSSILDCSRRSVGTAAPSRRAQTSKRYTTAAAAAAASPNTMPTSSAAAPTDGSSNRSSSPYDTIRSYKLLLRTFISADAAILRFAVPSTLGIHADIPTCLSIYDPRDGTAKSYSPISHPSTLGHFDLLLKEYDTEHSLARYLVRELSVYDESSHSDDDDDDKSYSIQAKLKKDRIMHGSTSLFRPSDDSATAKQQCRWDTIGLIGGGTGIAPLYQLAVILLRNNADTQLHILSINHTTHDILLHPQLNALVAAHPNVRITYLLTKQQPQQEEEEVSTKDHEHITYVYYEERSEDMDLAIATTALPSPSTSDLEASNSMIFVCGKTNFGKYWAGDIARTPSTTANDGTTKKGPKIQGPLSGLLKRMGFTESQVFKY